MELLYHLTVVIPTIVKTFLFMGVGIFLATVVWNLTVVRQRVLSPLQLDRGTTGDQ